MDRTIVYPGAIPLDSDLLNAEQQIMVGLGGLLQMCLGTGTYCDGLAGSQTTVASMTINIGPGSITSLQEVDATAFGSLGTNTASLVKQGINLGTTQFTLTAPSTSGQSINYLVEASFLEQDGTPVVLPYVNPANPASPYSGPANSGTAQNTKRKQSVQLQLKAGAAATTGTQTTPATDTGYVPLYVITVAYGQTSITTAQITRAAGSSFIGNKIPQIDNYSQLFSVILVKSSAYTMMPGDNGAYLSISGTTTITLPLTSGIVSGYIPMLANNGSGVVTINTNSATVYLPTGATSTSFALNPGDFVMLDYDGVAYRTLSGSAPVLGAAQLGQFSTVTSGTPGTAGSYTITKWPDPTTSSGYRVRISGTSAAFNSQTYQSTTLPITLNGVAPGGWGVSTFFPGFSASDDVDMQVIGAPTTTQIVIAANTPGGGTPTWPAYATYFVEGW
ncbi:MAG: hypothetical protein P4L10_10880 [Acidobacteriaceae bacterium]|nr:hypothetical protein [Acidobacteriaceae bacterium]